MSTPVPTHVYLLADGAQHPLAIGELIREAAEHRNVYAGLPEEEAGDASLHLARVDNPGDTEDSWHANLVELDLQAPCVTLIWSRVGIDALATHLQQFLLADIGDGVSVLLRYFDPRNLSTFLALWDAEVTGKLMAPIRHWKYRGHQDRWMHLDGPMHSAKVQHQKVPITLGQKQVDALLAHCEPDELLAGLVEEGVVSGEGPYLPRFQDFIARYRKAAAWGLTEPQDRLGYCKRTYQDGLNFDRDPEIHHALCVRRSEGQSFAACMERIPKQVWSRLRADPSPRSSTGESS